MFLFNKNLPLLAFSGYSGSGKTTLIKSLVERFTNKGLKVGYLKHDAHKLVVDKEGKDSDILFKAGAEIVCATSAIESFMRTPIPISNLSQIYSDVDIIFAEGYKTYSWDKIWVYAYSGSIEEKPKLENVIAHIGASGFKHNDIDAIEKFVDNWLAEKVSKKPLYGGLLVGGESKRMGNPKSLIPLKSSTFSETIYETVSSVTDKIYLLGNGPLPDSLLTKDRIPDIDEIKGPLSGIFSAHNFAGFCDWLIVAVDMPNLSSTYLEKLKKGRKPGFKFLSASLDGKPQTTCSIYSSQLISSMKHNFDGAFSIRDLLRKIKIDGNQDLHEETELRNINRPEDWNDQVI